MEKTEKPKKMVEIERKIWIYTLFVFLISGALFGFVGGQYWNFKGDTFTQQQVEGMINSTKNEYADYYTNLVSYLIADNSCYLSIKDLSCYEFQLKEVKVINREKNYQLPTDCMNDTVYIKIPFAEIQNGEKFWLNYPSRSNESKEIFIPLNLNFTKRVDNAI